MSPRDAFCHLVHDFPGGAAALAVRLGVAKWTLAHKADFNCTTHQPTFIEVVKAEQLTGDHRPLYAHAETLGYRCVRMQYEIPNDTGLLPAVNRFARETAEALKAMSDALEDGRITETEIRRFEKEVADIAPRAVALAERMRQAAAEQSRERALRPVVGSAA